MSNSKMSRRWLLAGTVLTSLIVGLPAMAQDTTPAATTDTTTTTTATPPAAPADDTPTEVVITGSRIRHSEFNSPSPVQIITSEKSSAAGMISATEILQSSSIANGSGQINNTFTGFVVNGGDGVNTVALRGLGSQRTLVLLNGHRMPPAGVGGTVAAVDLNTIPSDVVTRYEILKDGASSIYGSDAVAGVINIITLKHFDGFRLSTSIKASEKKGGDQYEYTALWGKTFDRGDFNISIDSHETKELTAGDRAAFACPMNNYRLADGSNADLIDPNTGTYKCYGGVTNGYVGTYYSRDYWSLLKDYGISNYFGSRAITPGSTANGVPGWKFIPYANRDFNDKRLESTSIISPVKTLNLFAQGEYRPVWADGAEIYGEFSVNNRKSTQHGWRTFFPFFNENSTANPFSVGSDPYFGLGFGAEPYMAVPSTTSQDVTVMRGMAGIRGDWNKWSWDVNLSTSHNDGKYTDIAIPNDRVEAGTGTNQLTKFALADGVCGPSAPAGCVPLDVFTKDILENGNFPQAMKDYYFVKETGKTTYDQTIFEANITGDLFQLPAGALSSAFGVSLRQDKINDVPGEFARNHNIWGYSTAAITKGSDDLSEAYAEFEVPLVKGKPFFEDLSLDTSVRFSNYKSVGSAWTYKLGFDWAVDRILRLRGTYGTSFRAPGLFELKLGNQTSYISQEAVDPCINYGLKDENGNFVQTNTTIRTNCAADGLPLNFGATGDSAQVITGGGSNLKPEESQASTFGIVLTPPETGFKLAIDFWRINVTQQIASTYSVVSQCYASVYFRTRPGYCDLFTRDSDGGIATVDASYRNIPSEKTAGIDFTAEYTKDFNYGTLDINGQATYTRYDKTQGFPGEPYDDFNNLVGEPKWVGNVQTTFAHKDWKIAWTVNYAEGADNNGFYGETGQTLDINNHLVNYRTDAPDFFTHDLTVRYNAKSWEIIAGVTNLLNKTPPYVGNSVYSSYGRLGNYPFGSQYYDGYIGRQFYLHLSKDF